MKIITSNTSEGAYLGVLNQLKSNLDGKSQNIVIAPDRFTASVERGLISSLGVESTFGIEVMSFTRLANKIIGNDIKKCLTPEGSVMLIGKVISDLRDELVYYKKVAMTEGFASELYAALTAIRNSGVSSEDLLKASQKSNASLKAKARDIALVYDGYLKALEGKHSDSSTRLYALAEYIKNHPDCVSTTNFYCTDIYDFSAPELEIIKGLSDSALSLTIGITSGYDNPNKRIYPDTVCKKLQNLCSGRVQIVRNDVVLPPQIDAISKKLFAYISTSAEEKVEDDGKVVLRSAKDRRDEVTALVCDVVNAVREGARYKDFEVYASDMNAYEAELKSAFERYDIPYFLDKKELLSEQTKTRYILDAIACVRSNFRRREVLDFAKNPLFYARLEGGLDEVFVFENYCLQFNIEYVPTGVENKFERTSTNKYFAKNKQNAGLIYTNCDDKTVVLDNSVENVIPEIVRKALVECLAEYDFKSKTKNIRAYVNATRALSQKADVYYNGHVDKLSSCGEYFKKVAEQVDDKIKAVLDEIENVLDYDTDITGFESVFKSMLKTLKIALVPTYLDCVFVGDADSRFSGNGNIYVLGANNGKLPRTSGGGVVITPKDEQTLCALGVDIYPSERQKVLTEMYAVCDLMKKPKGQLVVSFAESGDGGALRPSTIVFELQNMLCQNGKPLEIERADFEHYRTLDGFDDKKISSVFATKKGCSDEVMRNLFAGRTDAVDGCVFASANEFVDDIDKARMKKALTVPERISVDGGAYFEGSTSVSRLETFYGCPYAHYFNYILSLRRRKDGKFEGTENGTILHYVLEHFFKDVRDGKIDDNSDLTALAYSYFDGAIEENGFEVLLEKADTGRLLLRVRDEGAKLITDLYQVQKRSAFRPYLLEAKIGEGEIRPMSLDLGDKKVRLKGTIDRVDVLGDKFIIIDYKTYKSADLSLKELYCGQKIQLYVYMRAVEKSTGGKPSGVFYFPIFSSFTDEEGTRYKYKGQASDSMETLKQIDSMVDADAQKAIVPCKKDKKGALATGGAHLSTAQFDLLGDYAVDIATKGASEIANGYIKPSPIAKEKCKRCDFASICAYKEKFERKAPKVKGIESFEKEGEDNE